MSSNFWTSSHCNYHLHTRSALQSSPGRTVDLQYCSPRQLYLLHIWFAGLIHKLGKRCNLKSVPISTAIVFFKRFYIKNAICETNPYLVLVACVYVAAKVEETPLHIKNIVGDAKLTFNENGIKMFPSDSHKVGEMEFYLLEDLDFHLVVFHPIRAMLNMTGRDPADAGTWSKTRLQEDTEIRKAEAERAKKASQSGAAGGLGGRARSSSTASQSGIASMTSPGAAVTGHVDEEGETEEARIMRLMSRGTGEGLVDIDEHMLQMTMFIIADSYRTDVSLLYPPYIIALASIYIGCTMSATNMANAVAAATAAGASGNISPKPRSSQRPSASHAKSVEVNTALGIPLLPAVNALGGPGGGDHTASSPPSGSTIRRISSMASISSGAGRNAGANANASGPSPHSSQSGVPKKEPKPLAPAAKAIAAFIATFNVSLPVLFACVQDLLVLYPIWETFEQTPTGGRATPAPAAAGDVGRGFMSGASGSIGLGMPGGGSGVGVGISASGGPGGAPSPTSQQGSRPTFGPTQAEELVRKMIEDRAIDLSHPDNVSSHGGSTASMDAGVKKGAGSSGVPQVAGKKRRH